MDMVLHYKHIPLLCGLTLLLFPVMAWSDYAFAAVPPVDFPVTMSEAVNVVTSGGTPRVAIDVGGVTRYASYSAGTGTSSLTFTYTPTLGDVDLDGISIPSGTIDLNGGTIKDLAGNDLTPLTFAVPNTSGVKVNYPSLSMDFVYDADGRYTLNGTAYDTLPAFLTATGGSFTRASIGTYYDSAGTLQTATSGTPRFDYDPVTHAAKGILIEGSRVNKSRNYNANPTDLSNVGKSGDAASTLTVVSDSAALTSAGLSGICTSGNVYKLDNSAGTTDAFVVISGVNGNLNKHIMSIYARGSGIFSVNPNAGPGQNAGAIASQALTSSYIRYTGAQPVIAPTVNNIGMRVRAAAGSVVYFILNQFEEGEFVTSPITISGATSTRAADVLTVSTGAWFNGSSGTQFVKQYYTLGYQDYSPVIGSAQANLIGFQYQGPFGNSVTAFIDGATSASTGALAGSSLNSIAVSNSSTAVKISRNGGGAVNGGAKTLVGATTLYIGRDFNGTTSQAPKYIEKYKFYPNQISDAQLQFITQ